MLNRLLLVFVPLYFAQAEQQPWEYSGENGQQTWCEISQSCCGSRQSPIALHHPATLPPKTSAQQLRVVNYRKSPQTVTLTNTGHTVVVKFSDEINPLINIVKDGVKRSYKFSFIQFHWGKCSDRGSEHTINDTRAPMEMQIVHFNKKFGSYEDAVNSGEDDAVAILGVMFQSLNRNCYQDDNCSFDSTNDDSTTALNKMASSLNAIRFKDQSTIAESFSLRELLPAKITTFFRYHGSLTTPDCNQVVSWTIFDKPNYVTEHQLEEFRSLYSTKEGDNPVKPLQDNFRFLKTGSSAKAKYVRTF